MWSTLRKCGIQHELIIIIKVLYNTNSSSVLISNNLCNSFKSTVGIRQIYLLLPVLFNIFLVEIMSEVQDNLTSSISIVGIPNWHMGQFGI